MTHHTQQNTAVSSSAEQLLALQALQSALSDLRRDAITVGAFSELAQAQQLLLAALASRYSEVLMQLLSRLESSALFTEESCSFSRHDLLDSLQLWLDKAAQALQVTQVTQETQKTQLTRA